MGSDRPAFEAEELKLLNRLHRRLWVATLACHGAEALGWGWLILPLGHVGSWALLLAYLVLRAGLWVLLVATSVRLARVARPWWGLGPRSAALAVALGALLPNGLALAADLRMRSPARCLSLPGGFLGPREERLIAMGPGPMAPSRATPWRPAHPVAWSEALRRA